jgi:hypothetical protein
VDIEDVVVVEVGGDVEREGVRVRERGQAYANTVAADLYHDSVDHLKSKATPILEAATILVSAVVDTVLQELLDDVAGGAVNLHTIETCHGVEVRVRRFAPIHGQ